MTTAVEYKKPKAKVENELGIEQLLLKQIESFTMQKTNVIRKAGKFRSKFSECKFVPGCTILDEKYIIDSQFFGLYSLFWIGVGLLILNTLVHSYIEYDISFFETPVMLVLRKDIVKVGVVDLFMYLTSYFAFFLQYLCLKKYVVWDSSGWIIQNIYDSFYLVFWLYFASEKCMDFPWIAKIFLFLHSMVFLMKSHAYGFYNGYLWKVLTELEISTNFIAKLKDCSTDSLGDEVFTKTIETLEESIEFSTFELKYQAECTSLPTNIRGKPLNLPKNKFPQNITLLNYFEYSMFPTIIYTLNFPRTSKIRWGYVFEKISAIFGIFFLMITIAQYWLYPYILHCIAIRELTLLKLIQAYSLVLFDMTIPFLLIFLLNFYLIWDAILNCIAELSRFADRDFYGPWWSSSSWYEYSKMWNKPVHRFLLRHVYYSSVNALNLDRNQATIFTFLISGLFHEVAMYILFKKWRGYIILFQLSQLPLIAFSNSKLMKARKVLGNIICMLGLVAAPSLISSLYLVF